MQYMSFRTRAGGSQIATVDSLEGSDRGLFNSSTQMNDLSFTRFAGFPLELRLYILRFQDTRRIP